MNWRQNVSIGVFIVSRFLIKSDNKRSENKANIYDSLPEERIFLVDFYVNALDNVLNLDYEGIDHIPVYRVEKLYESTKTL